MSPVQAWWWLQADISQSDRHSFGARAIPSVTIIIIAIIVFFSCFILLIKTACGRVPLVIQGTAMSPHNPSQCAEFEDSGHFIYLLCFKCQLFHIFWPVARHRLLSSSVRMIRNNSICLAHTEKKMSCFFVQSTSGLTVSSSPPPKHLLMALLCVQVDVYVVLATTRKRRGFWTITRAAGSELSLSHQAAAPHFVLFVSNTALLSHWVAAPSDSRGVTPVSGPVWKFVSLKRCHKMRVALPESPVRTSQRHFEPALPAAFPVDCGLCLFKTSSIFGCSEVYLLLPLGIRWRV